MLGFINFIKMARETPDQYNHNPSEVKKAPKKSPTQQNTKELIDSAAAMNKAINFLKGKSREEIGKIQDALGMVLGRARGINGPKTKARLAADIKQRGGNRFEKQDTPAKQALNQQTDALNAQKPPEEMDKLELSQKFEKAILAELKKLNISIYEGGRTSERIRNVSMPAERNRLPA